MYSPKQIYQYSCNGPSVGLSTPRALELKDVETKTKRNCALELLSGTPQSFKKKTWGSKIFPDPKMP
jgi:hypothetical protein